MKTESKRIYSETELQILCEQYQALLGINDWKIVVELKPQGEMKGFAGRVHMDPVHESARIEIPTADTFNAHVPHTTHQNMQQCLLHELIHVVMAKCDNFKKGSLRHSLFETAIEKLANGYCKLLPEPAPTAPRVEAHYDIKDEGEPEKDFVALKEG